VRALELCSNNKAEAAQMLGIGRATIYSLIKRHRLEGEEEGA